MCGIIGYVGHRAAQPLLLDGLATLEYRGYDSAGIALERDGRAERVRSVGNLASLRAAVAAAERVPALAGGGVAASPSGRADGRHRPHPLGHARPRERGQRPPPRRRRPAASRSCSTASSRTTPSCARRSRPAASEFTSQTDAEAVSQLVGALYEGDLMEAVRAAYAQLHGHFAFVAMSADEPGLLVGARREAPLVIGAGDGEQFIASAISAFADSTDQLLLVEDGELVALRAEGVEIFDASGAPVAARAADDRRRPGGGRPRRLRDLHAQGDPRAVRRRGPHARGPARRRPRSASPSSA